MFVFGNALIDYNSYSKAISRYINYSTSSIKD